MEPISTIIFDLGGVLVDWKPEYVFRSVIPDVEKRKYFFDHVCTHDWNIEQDAGRSLADGTTMLVSQFPEWEQEIRSFYDRWEEMLGGPIPEAVELLRTLRDDGRYRLLALTNWSAETFPIALARYDFLHWFEGIVVSGVEKTRKPFPDIYRILLERYQVTPSSAVFVDDAEKNVLAAQVLGIRSVHFQSALQLRNALREWRIL